MIAPPPPVKPSINEAIKLADPTLAGAIGPTLINPGVDRFAENDVQFLKFHGIYQQDDRDKRKLGKQYIFMVRTRCPGGVLPPAQYLALDALATQYGNDTLRITSRQGFQFHGVVKQRLGPIMKEINQALVTTLAACGDVNRNVMAPSTPATSPWVERVLEDAYRLSAALLPSTPAYHQIWVEGTELNLQEKTEFVDPLYGKTYLPRKFKTAFAIPPLNDVDIFTNCLGFIAIIGDKGLAGYNLTAGGGLGMSHGNTQTFPRIADVIGFFTPEHIEAVAKAVLTVHRDFGDRQNRKHARLKYVLEDKGPQWFRQEVEARIGFKLDDPRPFHFSNQGDLYGWHRQANGQEFLGLYVETGRIKNAPGANLKKALRTVVEEFQVEVRLTPSQNILLANIPSGQRDRITRLLREEGISVENQSTPIRRASMACPALPTCGLALAESERYLPDLLGRVEALLGELGLADEEIIIRMTGCPNGCARPYMAEIGFVGKSPNKYQIYLGGNQSSTRLNRLFKDNVLASAILDELRPVLTHYKQARLSGERFGDFCARMLWPAPNGAAVSN